MTRRVSVADLLASITLLPAEAISIVQQLIHGPGCPALRQPFGPPAAETVFVCADGTAICDTCDAPFAVSDLAALIEAMLPAGKTGQELSLGVPGALRYTLARARLEVDAPPFDSAEEFSRALARHERGDRVQVIQRVLGRVSGVAGETPLDRRRSDPAVSQLRRQLRAADVRVYDQQRAIDTLSAMSPRPASGGKGLALAAGIAIGLTIVGAGHLMRGSAAPPAPRVHETARVATPAASTSPAPSEPRPPVAAHTVQEVAASKHHDAGSAAGAKRAVRSPAPSRVRETSRSRRFRWLKTRLVFRNDL